MPPYERRNRRTRWPVLLLDLLAIGFALAGLAAVSSGRLVGADGPPVRVSGSLSGLGASERQQRPSPARPSAEKMTVPLQLSIPAIGVDTPVVKLELNPDGTLQVPTDFSVAGWYSLGPSPGEPGPAIIAGHVDSKRGPAVFYRLGELAPGSVVRVTLADRTEAVFRVYAVREFAKSAFPTSLVYAPTRGAELRLITCGGAFDRQTGHYVDNIVVFARYAGAG
jgi:sortase (surface protein transpeptidase)